MPSDLNFSAIVPACCVAATVSLSGVSMIATVLLMPLRFSDGSTAASRRFFSSVATRDDADLALEVTALGERVDRSRGHLGTGIEGHPRRLRLLQVRGVHGAAEDRRVVLRHVAQRRVEVEEPDRGEDLLVLRQLHARLLRGRSADRVDRREDGHELAAVDATLLVQLVDDRVVRGLVVAVADVGDVADRVEVDVGDAELDVVLRHARRRRARDAIAPKHEAEHDERCQHLPHVLPPRMRPSFDAERTNRL